MIRSLLTALRWRAMLPPDPVAPPLAAIIAARAPRVCNRNRALTSQYIATQSSLARGPE